MLETTTIPQSIRRGLFFKEEQTKKLCKSKLSVLLSMCITYSCTHMDRVTIGEDFKLIKTGTFPRFMAVPPVTHNCVLLCLCCSTFWC